MKDKVTAKMIRKAVKRLEKHKIKPDKDGLIEIEYPKVRTDFFKKTEKEMIIDRFKKKGDNMTNNEKLKEVENIFIHSLEGQPDVKLKKETLY